ncbi:uncharacterized protein GIQ15_06873 [Arthroderma uncinatum]|uniref:uncharacterized protein n=1 Tax=Arthroderma uncinatum TaxID=74035 RepID=UPI00144AB3AC|nr:uncharacterized protein GIQ15_06873 [Arthroderma uncinatum]KAF3479897.1 hypothetical protein GIQ15_06873 [Arthroderma uncinatum]
MNWESPGLSARGQLEEVGFDRKTRDIKKFDLTFKRRDEEEETKRKRRRGRDEEEETKRKRRRGRDEEKTRREEETRREEQMSGCLCSASVRGSLLVDSHLFQAARPIFSNNRRHHASPSLGRYASTSNINIDSLSETLEDHRFRNRTVVRRVVQSKASTRPPIWKGIQETPIDRPPEALDRKFLADAHRESQKLQKLSKDLAKLNGSQIKQFYPNALKSSLQPADTPQSSAAKKTVEKPIQYNWLQYVDEQQSMDGYLRLGDELRAFEQYMSEIPQEKGMTERTILGVENVLRQVEDPDRRLRLIGSRHTGMAIRHSNIDLMIPIDDPDGFPNSVRGPSATRPKITTLQMDRLTQVARLLRATGDYSNVTVDKAHIPVVSAEDSATGRKVRIHCGIRPPSSLEYVLNYKAEFPTLRPIYIAIRMILETRGLLGTAQQSINQYGLTMLIVAALKLGEGRFDRLDLGRQFLHVLLFYSMTDLRRQGISVDPPELFKKRARAQGPKTDQPPHIRGQLSIGKKSMSRGNETLCLQDPADFMNDLGIECLALAELQQVFSAVGTDVHRKLKAWNGDAETGIETAPAAPAAATDSETPSLLGFALGSDYYHRLEELRDKAIFEFE